MTASFTSLPPSRAIGTARITQRYGVSLRTLRFYEDQGLLQPLREGELRFFTPNDELRLQVILKGRRLGFTLQNIRDLIETGRDGRSSRDRLGADADSSSPG